MLRQCRSTIPGLLVLFTLAPGLLADRLTPKPQAADYPAHLKLGNLEIGADYLVHSFSSGGDSFLIRNYLVFEVAFYPEKGGGSYRVSPSQFTLRVNGKKQVLEHQEASLVAISMKYQDSGGYPGFEAGAGVGGAIATIGRPLPGPRFPGDPTPVPRQPPQAPPDTDSQNVPKQERITAEDALRQTALVQSEEYTAISGYVFFPYSGNVKKLKSLELLYTDAAGPHVLRLQ